MHLSGVIRQGRSVVVVFVLFCCVFQVCYSKVVSEFLNNLLGNWKLQLTQVDKSGQWNLTSSLSSCKAPSCVRHLYFTTTSFRDDIIIQGSYLEFDQDEVVVNSLSFELVGFVQNDSFKIVQVHGYSDSIPKLDSTSPVSFTVSKSDEHRVFYITSNSFLNTNISLSSCVGAVLEQSIFCSCEGYHEAWIIFGERILEQEKEEGFRRYLPTVMIIVVFVVLKKLQSFLLAKRATLVPTSFGGS